MAEIQQTSDVTYRIYDFNRTDDQGNARELHTELAVDAIDYTFEKNYRTEYKAIADEAVRLVDCKYFTTNILPVTTTVERDFADLDTFVIYICLEGECRLLWEDQSVNFGKGETILVPALINSFSLSVLNGGTANLLEVYIK